MRVLMDGQKAKAKWSIKRQSCNCFLITPIFKKWTLSITLDNFHEWLSVHDTLKFISFKAIVNPKMDMVHADPRQRKIFVAP